RGVAFEPAGGDGGRTVGRGAGRGRAACSRAAAGAPTAHPPPGPGACTGTCTGAAAPGRRADRDREGPAGTGAQGAGAQGAGAPGARTPAARAARTRTARGRAAAARERERREAEQRQREEQRRAQQERREAERAEAQRQENLRRIQGLAGASGGETATGSAPQSAGPSATYAGRIKARVKPNIVFPDAIDGNPVAEVEVRTAPDGTIVGRRLVRSSGVREWDDAVLRAIDRTETLPRDVDGRVPPTIVIAFRPRD
nr:cell envelope integrity protein TolA [Ideonella sp.]